MKALRGYNHDACIIGTVRGEDGSGLFQVAKDGEVESYKLPYPGYFFIKDSRARSLIENSDSAIITIGHHRAATKGAVSLRNSHPFEHTVKERTVVGVHNGSLNTHHYREDGIEFSVDSDWIMYRIARDGGPEGVGAIEGAAALVWYEGDGKLRMFSNDARPLHWAYVKNKEAMIIMSESNMMWDCAARNGIDIEQSIWTFGHKDKIMIFDPEDVRNHDVEDIVKPKTLVTVTGNGWHGYNRRDWDYEDGHDSYAFTPVNRHNADKTFQGEDIFYGAKALDDLNLKMGMETEFFLCPKTIISKSVPATVIGEIMIENVVTGKPDIQYALMRGCTETIIENMKLAAVGTGEIVVRVIGVTNVIVEETRFLAAVVSIPSKVILDNNEHKDDIIKQNESLLDKALTNLLTLDIKGPKGDMISVDKFDELVKNGCSNCSSTITHADGRAGKVGWWYNSSADADPICSTCFESIAANGPI